MFDEDEPLSRTPHIAGASADAVTDYKRHIAKYPRGLSEDLENELLSAIAEGVKAHDELLIKAPDRSREDVFKLRRLQRKGEKARTELIEAHLVLVFNLAMAFAGQGVALLDLIQEGNLGLIKAIEKYEIGMAPRLANYAQWLIRQRMLRALDKFGHAIHVPKKVLEHRKIIDNAIGDLLRRTTRPLTHQDISDETGLSLSEISTALELPQEPISLATQIGSDGEVLLDLLSEMPEPVVDNEIPILTDALRQQIEKSLQVLEPLQREVIVARYGLEGGDMKTFDQIGKQLGLEPEMVRRLEMRAMATLRHPSRSNGLSLFRDN